MTEKQVFDLWPLPWWKNPWWLFSTGIGLLCVICLIAYGIVWFIKRKRVPRPLHEQLIMRLQGIQELPLVHDHERCCVYIELIHMMREYAHHVFGIMSDGMTDIEFLRVLDTKGIRDHCEDFMNLVETMSDEVSLAKFAARPISRDIVIYHISLLDQYFKRQRHSGHHISSK